MFITRTVIINSHFETSENVENLTRQLFIIIIIIIIIIITMHNGLIYTKNSVSN